MSKSKLIRTCILTTILCSTRALAGPQDSDVPDGKSTVRLTGSAQIVFGPTPASVFRSVTVTNSCRDVNISARDCCIRDDVVEIYVNGCKLAVVDSRGGASGTHVAEVNTVTLPPGTHQIEYRNTVSNPGNSGWSVSESEASTFTGRHPCGGNFQTFVPFRPGDTCGNVTSDVLLREFSDDAGDKIRLLCRDQAPHVDEFRLEYVPAGEQAKMIGRCPWEAGCNQSFIYHSGDLNRNGTPDCFVASRYTSTDQQYGDKDDNGDGKVGSVHYTFDVATCTMTGEEYARNSPPELVFFDQGPAGAEDPFFSSMIPSGGPMRSVVLQRCDLNGDGNCDAQDETLLQDALGSCRGEAEFEPLADVDGDGCITQEDRKIIRFEVFRDDFEVGDTTRWSQTRP